MGPFLLRSETTQEQVYIMVTEELVTNICHLIPIKDTSVKSLIRALETQKSKRGQFFTILLDKTKSDHVLQRATGFILHDLLCGEHTLLLAQAGIIVESIIKHIKKVVIVV